MSLLHHPNKSLFANGTTIPIKGKGKVNFGPNLSINLVLYVPDLTLSLISIKQLTQDLNCNAVFSPYVCKFQDMDMGRTIGVAKEQHGLYILQGRSTKPKDQPQAAYSTQKTASDRAAIWLHHLCLGHPPFSLVKQMFPTLFRTLDPSIF